MNKRGLSPRVLFSEAVDDALARSIREETMARQLRNGDPCTRQYIEQLYGPVTQPKWINEQDGCYLFDEWTQQVCVVCPMYRNPQRVTSRGGRKRLRTSTMAMSLDLPALGKDVLSLILRHLGLRDLLRCRQVSRLFCRVATATFQPLHIGFWDHLPPFQQFVQASFLGCSERQIVAFLAAYPDYFALMLGRKLGKLKMCKKDPSIPEPFRVAWISPNARYWIPYGHNVIRSNKPNFGFWFMFNDYYRLHVEKNGIPSATH